METLFAIFYRIPGRSVQVVTITSKSKGDARKWFYAQHTTIVYDIVDILTIDDALQRYADTLTSKFKGRK